MIMIKIIQGYHNIKTNRKSVCDFALVANSNFVFSYCFRNTATKSPEVIGGGEHRQLSPLPPQTTPMYPSVTFRLTRRNCVVPSPRLISTFYPTLFSANAAVCSAIRRVDHTRAVLRLVFSQSGQMGGRRHTMIDDAAAAAFSARLGALCSSSQTDSLYVLPRLQVVHVVFNSLSFIHYYYTSIYNAHQVNNNTESEAPAGQHW